MADKLFYTYSNSSQSKTEASAKSTAHPYSPIFDGGRKSIWTNGTEYGYFGLGPSSGSGSIISSLTINSNHELCASYISVTDLNNSLTADNFQSASFDSGLQISTHQENGTNCGSGHLFVPAAATNQYGVIKVKAKSTTTTVSDIGAANSANRYGVILANDGVAYVSVPWENTKCTSAANHYTPQTGMTAGTIEGTRDGTELSHGDRFEIPSITYDSNGHIKTWTANRLILPSETTLSLGTNNGGAKAINRLTVSGHTITASYVSIPDAAKNGKLYVRKDTDTGSSIMTANQSGNTYLSFSAGTGISIAQSSGTVTITNSLPNSHNSHALSFTNNTASAITSATTLTFVESVSGCDATAGNLTATTTRKKIVIGNGVGLVGINSSGQLTYNASGGNAEGCVTYTTESNGIHTITVATTPGTATNTLYIIL